MRFLLALVVCLLASLPVAAQLVPPPPDPEVAATVTQILGAAHHPRLSRGSIGDVTRDLWPLYGDESDRLLWFERGQALPSVEGAVLTVGAVHEFGLEPDDYDAAALQVQWAAVRAGQASAAARAQFDVALSVAAARLFRAVHVGRVDPARSLEPALSHDVRARATLSTYRTLADGPEPPVLPALASGQKKIVPGQAWQGVPQLVARLRAVGDLVADVHETQTHYTGTIVDAVRRFQVRHGLEADGVIGAGTVRALNVPLADRVRQIELAMERMRWLPHLPDRQSIFVNVANFRLWANDPRTKDDPCG